METVQTKNCILDQESIERKLKRMALEVAEENIEEKELIIAGVNGNGEIVAGNLAKALQAVHSFQIHTTTIQLNKKDPASVELKDAPDLDQKAIIIVDDVANTGRTLLYALKPFLDAHPKKIQTLVLVERSHKLFPVETDFRGLSIATTLQEHIAVESEEGRLTGAWLY